MIQSNQIISRVSVLFHFILGYSQRKNWSSRSCDHVTRCCLCDCPRLLPTPLQTSECRFLLTLSIIERCASVYLSKFLAAFTLQVRYRDYAFVYAMIRAEVDQSATSGSASAQPCAFLIEGGGDQNGDDLLSVAYSEI